MPEEDLTKDQVEEAFKATDVTLAEALDSQEAETPADPSTEDKPEEEAAPSPAADNGDEENTPFHKRWKQREAKLREEYESQIRAIREEAQKGQKSPDFAKDIYGDNEEGLKKVLAFEEQILQKAEQRALDRLLSQQREEQAKVHAAEEWLTGELDVLRKEGKQFDQNKLLKIVVDEKLVDTDGNWNLRAAFKLYEAESRPNAAKSVARKQLADSTTVASKGDVSKKPRISWEQMRKAGTHPDFDSLGF